MAEHRGDRRIGVLRVDPGVGVLPQEDAEYLVGKALSDRGDVLEIEDGEFFQQYRKKKNKELQDYRWLNPKTGSVQIPIDQAMKRLVNQESNRSKTSPESKSQSRVSILPTPSPIDDIRYTNLLNFSVYRISNIGGDCLNRQSL